MFSWFKRKSDVNPQPAPLKQIPIVRSSFVKPELLLKGIATSGRMELTDGVRKWTESFDVVTLLAEVLRTKGIEVAVHDGCLRDNGSGLLYQPQVQGLQPIHKQGFSSVTTVQVNHPDLFPKGVFEFQHSTGTDLNDSLQKGFERWAELDLVVLREALRDKAEHCTAMEMTFPATESSAARTRRILLGPVAHLREKQIETDSEHPPFCTCCLLTQNFDAFMPLVEGDEFCAIRLFAAREQDGKPAADCRVNGQDFDAGKQALQKYVERWPDAGFEFRKQYIVIQSK